TRDAADGLWLVADSSHCLNPQETAACGCCTLGVRQVPGHLNESRKIPLLPRPGIISGSGAADVCYDRHVHDRLPLSNCSNLSSFAEANACQTCSCRRFISGERTSCSDGIATVST